MSVQLKCDDNWLFMLQLVNTITFVLHWFWNFNEIHTHLTVQSKKYYTVNCAHMYLIMPFLKVLKIIRFLPFLSVSLYKMLAWIWFWDFIIAEVIQHNDFGKNLNPLCWCLVDFVKLMQLPWNNWSHYAQTSNCHLCTVVKKEWGTKGYKSSAMMQAL